MGGGLALDDHDAGATAAGGGAAGAAAGLTARAGGELVRPFRTNDCDGCEWYDYCADVVGAFTVMVHC